MADIRKLADPGERVETGPVQFGDDWPGIFIRGDHAFWLCGCMDALLACLPPVTDAQTGLARTGLEGLRRTLSASDLTGLSKLPDADSVQGGRHG